jgi:hypothetical protein
MRKAQFVLASLNLFQVMETFSVLNMFLDPDDARACQQLYITKEITVILWLG